MKAWTTCATLRSTCKSKSPKRDSAAATSRHEQYVVQWHCMVVMLAVQTVAARISSYTIRCPQYFLIKSAPCSSPNSPRSHSLGEHFYMSFFLFLSAFLSSSLWEMSRGSHCWKELRGSPECWMWRLKCRAYTAINWWLQKLFDAVYQKQIIPDLRCHANNHKSVELLKYLTCALTLGFDEIARGYMLRYVTLHLWRSQVQSGHTSPFTRFERIWHIE